MVALHGACDDSGAGPRELASTAKAFLNGINILHDAYLAGKDANPGKLPVVVLNGEIPITSGSGDKRTTNYQPKFEIVSWSPRPKNLVRTSRANSSPAPGAHAAPPATGGTKVGAPISNAAPAASVEDENAFG
jgi:hypothetical protein